MKYYKISEDLLRQFIRQDHRLIALESGGVDNWSWYSESLHEYGEILADTYNLNFDGFFSDLIEDVVDKDIQKFDIIEEK